METVQCVFDLAWIGRCKKIALVGSRVCNDHILKKCAVCGFQATKECDHTAQFVCGVPLCDDCEGTTDQTGDSITWTTGGHRHSVKMVKEEDYEKENEMKELNKPYFKVFQSSIDEQWYWHLVGGNGEIMCESEAYVSHEHASRAAKRFPEVVMEADPSE